MARGTRLDVALTMLKNKIRTNITPGVSLANDSTYAMDIARTQAWLATQYDWPFLEERWDIQLEPFPLSPANPTPYQPWRYYYFPTLDEDNITVAINFERPLNAYIWWSQSWLDLDIGIGIEEFNFRNSDGSPPDTGVPPETLDPVQRWQYNDQIQFEVWPVPASTQTLRFVGQRVVNPLTTFTPNASPATSNQLATPNWTATLDLDDEMVTLFAAAEILADKPAGQILMKNAQNRMAYVRASYPKRTKIAGFGQHRNKQLQRNIPVRVNIAVA